LAVQLYYIICFGGLNLKTISNISHLNLSAAIWL